VLLAVGNTLADSSDHIPGLADANADLAPLITNDNDGPEAHLFAALDSFGNASDLNNTLLPFRITFLATTAITAPALPAAITTAAFALTAALAASFLAFRAGAICGGRNVAGLKLFVGFGHGERRNQN
jgi:hypothetical protein